MYLRMATGPDTLPCAYAYIEFTNQTSVPIALQNNGIDFQGRPLRYDFSSIVGVCFVSSKFKIARHLMQKFTSSDPNERLF